MSKLECHNYACYNNIQGTICMLGSIKNNKLIIEDIKNSAFFKQCNFHAPENEFRGLYELLK